MNSAFVSGKGGWHLGLLRDRSRFLQNTRMTRFWHLRRAPCVVKKPLKKLLSWCDSTLDVRFSLDRGNRNQNPTHHQNTCMMPHAQETPSLPVQSRVDFTPPTYLANSGAPWRPIASIFCHLVANTSKNTPSERKQGKHQRIMPFTIKTYNSEFYIPICSDSRVIFSWFLVDFWLIFR